MRIYTQAEFNAFQENFNGYIDCPTGDYSKVYFSGRNNLRFADGCVLGNGFALGDYCELGNRCKLGNYFELGDYCKLGDYCALGDYCKLGDYCALGDRCELGDCCKLGNRCKLENGSVRHATYFSTSNIGSESRTVYCYCNTETGKIFIRAGCWFGSVDAFAKRVTSVHKDTIYAQDYHAMIAFARERFKRYLPTKRSEDT